MCVCIFSWAARDRATSTSVRWRSMPRSTTTTANMRYARFGRTTAVRTMVIITLVGPSCLYVYPIPPVCVPFLGHKVQIHSSTKHGARARPKLSTASGRLEFSWSTQNTRKQTLVGYCCCCVDRRHATVHHCLHTTMTRRNRRILTTCIKLSVCTAV